MGDNSGDWHRICMPDGTPAIAYVQHSSGPVYSTDFAGLPKSDRRTREAESAVDREVRARLEADATTSEVERRLAIIRRFGADVYEDGTVFRFRKQFAENGPEYSYAAIKANGKIYLTGSYASGALTWVRFTELLVFGVPTERFEVASDWKTVPV